MAPRSSNQKVSVQKFFRTYINYEYFKSVLLDPENTFLVSCLLVILEIVINVAVINSVKYTEIDWKAYMQEVEGVLNGTYDYSLLKGDTGPLVYPAGFVWFFSGLYMVTNKGQNIRLAQYIFAALYLLNLILVLRIHVKSKSVPPFVLVLSCLTSYRIHSIFILRLFNDPVAMVFFYLAINAFLDYKWSLGSFFFSLAVSIKMNILLFAPALLLCYIMCLGIKETIIQLSICAGVQIILALPFLVSHPINYLIGAFNFGRIFLYEWTVNWRFLPEYIFVNRMFHIGLLFLHVLLLIFFYKSAVLYLKSYNLVRKLQSAKEQRKYLSKNVLCKLFLMPLFLANLIGIICSRSLHYQFYIWYFHTLPFLVFTTSYSLSIKLILLGVIEMSWNTFPSTSLSSLSLLCAHLAILFGVYEYQWNHPFSSGKLKK